MNIPTIQSTSLYFREGNSDKEYHTAIEPSGEGYIVTFAYGRRGNTLTTGTKTPTIVTLEQATAIHAKLIREKTAKGYRQSGESTQPYQQSGNEGNDSGIRCQLLNAIDESELNRLLTNNTHCLQEKHDGRLMVRKQGDTITGINRRGLVVAIPDAIREAVEHIPFDVLIDGEAVGDTLHAFDILEVKNTCMRMRRYIDRFASLMMVIPSDLKALRYVNTVVPPADKLRHHEELKNAKREGVVFKDMDAPYSPGRPNSGGPQLKFKFVESASFVVTGINTKRSVTLGLYDGDKLVPAGNVTIPPNHRIPEVGEVCETRYLYAYRESGCIYQPVYLGPRTDIPASECVVEQLKFKAQAEAA
jgi:bifunctional non-homologous end joining protein LigD